jgi:Protein of unknown function (DUF2877)
MRIAAAASSALYSVLTGPARPARWLGSGPAALYLRVSGQPGIIAVLAHDAVRLPCGLLLPATRAEMPLSSLVPPGPDKPACVAGDGQVAWAGPAGPVALTVVRYWAPARVASGQVAPSAVAAVRPALPGLAAAGLEAEIPAGLGPDRPDVMALRLLGRGPGLTPAGDDVLAGFLAGANAFGIDVTVLRHAVARLAPAATTALSAGLLWHAARGECIDEAAHLAGALTGRGAPVAALSRLLAVGHTSGPALAWGLVLAAERALAGRSGLVAAAGAR